MKSSRTDELSRRLRHAALLDDARALTDEELLRGFIESRDEACFVGLVERHGPMVWGVCRRVIHNHFDAEDVFQATFLVLVRKAASIEPRDMVANWLYGVAHQTALKARATIARRKKRETQVADLPDRAVTDQDSWSELRPLLDQEITRLPDRYRVVVVLCDLEGRTRKDVARHFGCAEGTVAGRLARARAMLAKRLAGRGLGVSAGVLGVAVAGTSSACVPRSVASSTIQIASRVVAGQQTAGVVPVNVAALTQGVVKIMVLNKLLSRSVVLIVAMGILVIGSGFYGQQTGAKQGGPEKPLIGSDPAPLKREQAVQTTQPATRAKDNLSPEEQARQADHKARILFAHSSSDLNCVASIRMGEKKETLILKPPARHRDFEDCFRISPDGKRIAYRVHQRTDGESKYAIHIRDLDPEGVPVDLGIDGQELCWSGDGTQIAVSRGQAGTAIVDVATKKQTPIKLPEEHWITDWSSDGQWFLVQFKTDKGLCQLARMKRDDGEIEHLPGTEGGVYGGRISRDGKSVLFDRLEGKFVSNLWVLNLEDGKTRQVTQASNGFIRGYAWSPSGKRIAYTWVRFDPDNEATAQFGQETESFVTAYDLDTKKETILLSAPTRGTSAVHLSFWDWR
jgi:RNA polymerase sigma factor (sigma-70 family)